MIAKTTTPTARSVNECELIQSSGKTAIIAAFVTSSSSLIHDSSVSLCNGKLNFKYLKNFTSVSP